MTVKKLTKEQKQAIATIHQAKTKTQKEMAQWLGVSERTINRVLNELGLLTAVPRLKGDAYTAVQLMRGAGVNLGELPAALSQFTHGPSRAQIIKAAVDMEEGTWGALLSEIVTARVAKAATTHTQTAMLNIQQAVERNARDNQQG